ncbi:17292_t:CDS:2, partial [Gigaspora margarita]
NKELKEKLQHITNLYEDYKSDLEKYYNVIQRTYSILQEAFSSNKIDTRQLTDLYNEIRKVCKGSEVDSNIPSAAHSLDDLVYNSFNDALMESEPKIEEIDAGQSFPSLVRYPRFYEKTYNQEYENTNDTYDQEFLSF